MTIFMSPEYPCLRICTIEDAKVIDWICTGSKLIWQSETNKYLNKTRKTNNAAHRRRTTQRRTKTTKSEKKNEIDVKITYFNKREREKRFRGVILGQKMTLNHLSLMEEGKETRVSVTAHTREKEKREVLEIVLIYCSKYLILIFFH